MPSPIDPTKPTDLAVAGTLPLGLSGQLIGAGCDGVLHSFHFHDGRVTYVARSIGSHPAVRDVVAFDGSILIYGADHSVRQLTTGIDNPRQVDLAGHRCTVTCCPTCDPASGELHLIARDRGSSQVHVVIPAGALTRRNQPIADAPARIEGLAIGLDHVVYLADRMAGVARRDGEGRTTWTPTEAPAPHAVHAHRQGNTVVLLALTPALERWIFRLDGGALEREILDPTARSFAHARSGGPQGLEPIVWTTGGETIGRHDVIGPQRRHLSLAPNRPGDFAIVADATRPDVPAGGWIVGFVHHPTGDAVHLRVFETAAVDHPALATIRIPRPASQGLRCAWLQPPPH